MRQMMRLFNEAKRVEGTGCGSCSYRKGTVAMNLPDRIRIMFHGIGPFDIKTGKPTQKKSLSGLYGCVCRCFVPGAQQRREAGCHYSCHARMGPGCEKFCKEFPDRFFDVGIAEEHAVSFAAGLALGGVSPVVAMLFLLFAESCGSVCFTMCACRSLHVIFAVDRAGLVGAVTVRHIRDNFRSCPI